MSEDRYEPYGAHCKIQLLPIILYCCADAKTSEWVHQPAWHLASETLPCNSSYTRYYNILPGELISVRPSSRVQQTWNKCRITSHNRRRGHCTDHAVCAHFFNIFIIIIIPMQMYRNRSSGHVVLLLLLFIYYYNIIPLYSLACGHFIMLLLLLLIYTYILADTARW